MKTKLSNWAKAEQAQAVAGAFWVSITAHASKSKTATGNPTIDELVRKYTVAGTLDELCEVGKESGYRPSIYGEGNLEKARLADAYDARQAELGDPRRAYRG